MNVGKTLNYTKLWNLLKVTNYGAFDPICLLILKAIITGFQYISLKTKSSRLFMLELYLYLSIYKACPSESGTDKFMQEFI
jgi:hypothetical protein